jgi:hypothetical protein
MHEIFQLEAVDLLTVFIFYLKRLIMVGSKL